MVDFVILSAPVAISFTCPFCEDDTKIPWRKVKAPKSWSDDWGEIECPECGQSVALGDWIYD